MRAVTARWNDRPTSASTMIVNTLPPTTGLTLLLIRHNGPPIRLSKTVIATTCETATVNRPGGGGGGAPERFREAAAAAAIPAGASASSSTGKYQ